MSVMRTAATAVAAMGAFGLGAGGIGYLNHRRIESPVQQPGLLSAENVATMALSGALALTACGVIGSFATGSGPLMAATGALALGTMLGATVGGAWATPHPSRETTP